MIPAALLVAGFTLGAAGSLHCIGMCGPLSLVLPTAHFSNTGRFLALLLYQVGRIITYSILGLIIGIAGRSIHMAGLQQSFSILMGFIVLSGAAIYIIGKHSVRISFLKSFYAHIQYLIIRLLKSQKNIASFLLLGAANGLLPCGMVYIAIVTTLSFPEIYQGVLFMVMFGAGTLPAMLLVAYGVQMAKPKLRQYFRKAIPFFMAVMGIILILRGLNLNISYLSPFLPQATEAGEVIRCMH